MATGILTNTITDANGAVVATDAAGNPLVVTITLKPGPGFRSNGSEIVRKVTTTVNGSGVWTIALERSADILPATTSFTYEVYEPIPDARGGSDTWLVRVGAGTQTVQASQVSPPPAQGTPAYMTQAQADARYAALGNPAQVNTSNIWTAQQLFGSGRPWFDVDTFAGVDPTGATDSSAGLALAFTAVAAVGGVLHFSADATYRIDSTWSLTGATKGVRCFGNATKGTGSGRGTTLLYKGTGTASGVDFSNSAGVIWDGINVIYDSVTYAGDLMKTGGTSADITLQNFYVGSRVGTAISARSLIRLIDVQDVEVNEVHLGYADLGIYGTGGGLGSFSNNVLIKRVTQGNNLLTTAAVKNAGNDWTIFKCIGEPLANGKAGFYTQDTTYSIKAFQVIGGWFGDASAANGAVFGLGGFEGADFIGGLYSANGQTGMSAVKLLGGPTTRGLGMRGIWTDCTYAVDFGAGAADVNIGPNRLSGSGWNNAANLIAPFVLLSNSGQTNRINPAATT